MVVIIINVIGIGLGLCLLGGLIGMFTVNSDPLTDEQLYGMSADEYEKKMMGEEEYEKHINFYKHKDKL